VKEEKMAQERNWIYHNLQIKEGLKPGAAHYQYFFMVSQGDEKKCNYCVWVEDELLAGASAIGTYEDVAASKIDEWRKWVKGKIDKNDFRNVVLRIGKTGQKELDVKDMQEKLTFE
jgi:hypothetical protein